jgi:hypothetical protein
LGGSYALPEHFRDRAREFLDLAKRVFNPKIKDSLNDWATALTRFSVELGYHLAIRDDIMVLTHLGNLDAVKWQLRRLTCH